jgi:UDP-N-acetylmuramate dehydrogenase
MTAALAPVADALDARLSGRARVERSVPIARFTTYRLGGPAALLVRVDRVEVLPELAAVIAAHQPPVLIVGRGSNLLVADAGFPGVAVVFEGEFAAFSVDEPGAVRAGGAVALPALARAAAAAGAGGLEFFVGIPGSVGGAVQMNAGGHGQETADVLLTADVFDLMGGEAVMTRGADALDLGYRHSNLQGGELVVRAAFAAVPTAPGDCARVLAEVVQWRREHQPGGANAGSVFRNPPGDSAGRIIDSLGLKGTRVGGAYVSPKHANFFQAEPGATADDVFRLVRLVRARVRDATGIDLVPELRTVGFAEEP